MEVREYKSFNGIYEEHDLMHLLKNVLNSFKKILLKFIVIIEDYGENADYSDNAAYSIHHVRETCRRQKKTMMCHL